MSSNVITTESFGWSLHVRVDSDAGTGVAVVAVELVPGGDGVDAAVSSVRERANI